MTENTIEQLLADHQAGHSELQIDRFIIEKGNWTPYGRYKQALREIDSRHASLQAMREDAEIAELELRSVLAWFRRLTRRGQIANARQRRKLEGIRRVMATQQRELDRLVTLAAGLKEQIGELTDERRAELDAELWAVRTRAMLALDLFAGGRPSPGTAELLVALPEEIRQPILEDAREPSRLMRWLQDGPTALPE